MATQEVDADNTPTMHSVQVHWFQRDPGGGTIFVKPAENDRLAPHPVARHEASQ